VFSHAALPFVKRPRKKFLQERCSSCQMARVEFTWVEKIISSYVEPKGLLRVLPMLLVCVKQSRARGRK
jgi:hypothetical protein